MDDIEEISPKRLCETLIEKHDYYINEYQNSIESQKRLTILREKKDQLENWVADAGGEAFKKEYEQTVQELEKLEENMISTDMNYNQMKSRLDEHKKSKAHWVKKLEEYKDE